MAVERRAREALQLVFYLGAEIRVPADRIEEARRVLAAAKLAGLRPGDPEVLDEP